MRWRFGLARVLAMLLAVVLSFVAPRGASAADDPPAESGPGRHIVLLVDDSRDMRRFEGAVREHLPDLLLGGGADRGVGWPSLDPSRDVLTTLFFTIHRDGRADDCKENRRFSTLPEAMFQEAVIDAGRPADGPSVRGALDIWLALPCRWGGRYSPVVTATTLALPFSARRLEPQAFTSTLLVVVTNGLINPAAVSPAFELHHLTRSTEEARYLRDVEETARLVQQVLPRFRFDRALGWSRTIDTREGPLYIEVFRVRPMAAPPEALVAVSPSIELDRVATSSETIIWRGGRQGTDRVRLTAADGMTPLWLSWRLHDGQGRPWTLGAKPVPAEWGSIELAECGAACSLEGGALVVGLGELLELPAMERSDPVPRSSATLDLRAGFHYAADDVYDFLHPTSEEQVELRLAPMMTVESSPLVAAQPLTNDLLASLWRATDAGGLSQAVAFDRLVARRGRQQFLAALAAVAATALGVLALFLTSYHRSFEPALDWRSAGEVTLDLSHNGSSRLLVGTVGVENLGRQPWFGRLLRHDEQPTRPADLDLKPVNFRAFGFCSRDEATTVLGFLGTEGERGDDEPTATASAAVGDGLVNTIHRSVSHCQRVPVFLATEALSDFERPSEQVEETCVAVESTAGLTAAKGARATTLASFELRVVPEPAALPRVWFEAATGRLEFRRDTDLEVGAFVFDSQAKRRFALPFEADYALEVLRDGVPLGGRAFRLGTPKVRVASHRQLRVPVLLRGDGGTVTNPDPISQSYTLQLQGPCDAESRRGPHEIVLHRDSTRAEAEIRMSYLGNEWDLHRTAAGEVVLRGSRSGRTLRPDDTGRLELEGDSILRIPPERWPGQDPTLATLEVGNSGRSGRGKVSVKLRRSLDLLGPARSCLHLAEGVSGEDLVTCFRDGAEVAFVGSPGEVLVEVGEGQPPEECVFKLRSEPVTKIDGARLAADQVRAILELSVEVVDDQGETTTWGVALVARLALEMLPGLNWLCIDFGTSAIAAAVGRSDGDAFQRVDLQEVEVAEGKTLAAVDAHNTERGTPFLPSGIACDGDLRLSGSNVSDEYPPGFPLHRCETVDLRKPSFVQLPAPDSVLTASPGRFIPWLKERLGSSSNTIPLDPPVRYQLGGREQTRSSVPLDELVETTLGALFECYLSKAREVVADQVVFTHPNTFSARHRERLHRIASRVLHNQKIVDAPEQVALLSESDAVAYDYCVRRMTGAVDGHPRGGSERILVYDFGAGTVDLSLVRIEWRSDRIQPASWTIEARLGLPLAGNYIDEILMRRIDRTLRRSEVVEGTDCAYEYPAVASRSAPGRRQDHRDAVYKTWTELREAKHRWDGRGPFDVRVGRVGLLGGVVVRKKEGQLGDVPPAGRAGLYLVGSEIWLSIPAAEVLEDRRLSEFHELVTGDLVDELLAHASLGPESVDTLLVSGRGALFPGIEEGLQRRLPRAQAIDPGDALSRKDVVARGAIAFQALRHRIPFRFSDRARQPLGIILGQRMVVTEDEWSGGRPVDLTGCEEFRLVQIGLHRSVGARDLEGLRRHFFVELTDAPIRTRTLWQDDPRLFVRVKERGERLRIALGNAAGQEIDLDSDAVAAGAPSRLPWLMGSFLLEPEEEGR